MWYIYLWLFSRINDIPLSQGKNECRRKERIVMRQNQLIEKITASQLRDDIPNFRAGDTVRVHALIVEGSRERVQLFEGVVIKRHGSGISATYTVRKISNGIGVERTFPVNSPRVAKIEVVRHGRVRRAKLYYLRARTGKATRIAERRREDSNS